MSVPYERKEDVRYTSKFTNKDRVKNDRNGKTSATDKEISQAGYQLALRLALYAKIKSKGSSRTWIIVNPSRIPALPA